MYTMWNIITWLSCFLELGWVFGNFSENVWRTFEAVKWTFEATRRHIPFDVHFWVPDGNCLAVMNWRQAIHGCVVSQQKSWRDHEN